MAIYFWLLVSFALSDPISLVIGLGMYNHCFGWAAKAGQDGLIVFLASLWEGASAQ